MSHGITLALLLTLGAGDRPASEVLTVDTREFLFPIMTRPERQKDIRELLLERSTDQGRTWEMVARATPTDKDVRVTVPADGLYWFRLQIVMRNGDKDASPEVRVRVQTEKLPPLPNSPAPPTPAEEVARLKDRIRELEQRLEKLEKKQKD
jgi:hypothetical protein